MLISIFSVWNYMYIYNTKLLSKSLYSFSFYWNMLLPWRGNMWRESRLCREGRRKQLRLCLSYRLLWRRISEWNWLYRWWAQLIYSLTFDTANYNWQIQWQYLASNTKKLYIYICMSNYTSRLIDLYIGHIYMCCKEMFTTRINWSTAGHPLTYFDSTTLAKLGVNLTAGYINSQHSVV